MHHFPPLSAGRGHMPPLSALGWFVDTRCASQHRVPMPEDPELLAGLAANAEPVAPDAPGLGTRLWRRFARWSRSPDRKPQEMVAAGTPDFR